jgi:hypothetical protein
MRILVALVAIVLFFLSCVLPQELESLDIAICLTGQLARLELLSKIRNIFIPNAILGHRVHVFAILDNNITNVKQTYYRFDYSDNVYNNMNAYQLQRFIGHAVNDSMAYTSLEVYKANIIIHPVS